MRWGSVCQGLGGVVGVWGWLRAPGVGGPAALVDPLDVAAIGPSTPKHVVGDTVAEGVPQHPPSTALAAQHWQQHWQHWQQLAALAAELAALAALAAAGGTGSSWQHSTGSRTGSSSPAPCTCGGW